MIVNASESYGSFGFGTRLWMDVKFSTQDFEKGVLVTEVRRKRKTRVVLKLCAFLSMLARR